MGNYEHFALETDADGIALVTWDSPDRSMNVLGRPVLAELDRLIDEVRDDDRIHGAVITSGKEGSFSGGADVRLIAEILQQYQTAKEQDPERAVRDLFETAGWLSRLFRKLESCGKPVVAAINGVCLGGAFELALACHARVVVEDDSIRLGLPEVKIGILPGAGGTQRVPRLCDTRSALEMLTTGKSLSPKKAKALGLVTQIVPAQELLARARQLIRDGLEPVQPWERKDYRLPGGKVYSAAGANLWPAASAILRRETYGNYPAPIAILKCVHEGLQLPFDLALRVEQRYFTQLLRTTEAAMMIRTLFLSVQELNKGARRPQGMPDLRPRRVGIIGAGFMGAGIAYVTAKAGMSVVLVDRDLEAAEKGKAHSAGLMDDAIRKGRATEAAKADLLGRINATADIAALSDCDLVIEAVFEDSAVKRNVIEQAEAAMPAGAILASNTSTIPITSLAGFSARPRQFVGIHFFSPVDRMMLVEIILGRETGEQAVAAAFDYVRAIGKTPVIVNDTRGFFVNRCVLGYIGEAYDMLIEGVPPPMIENAARMAGMPVGPLALNDEIALDLAQKIMKQTLRDLGEGAVDPRHMQLMDAMVDEHGRLGRKNGKGFYDYPPKPAKKRLWPGLASLFPPRAPETFDIEELKQRFLVIIALEAARIMEEGIVTDPREADVGSILAFGFAPYTGGVLSYIDGMGVDRFLAVARSLEAKFGSRFRPPALLAEMAGRGETFHERFRPAERAA